MKTDTLSRRTRFEKPQPRDLRIEISAADIAVFDALQRHGPLPTDILYLLAKDKRGNLQAHKHRLTQLYNGTIDGRRWIVRPAQQFNNRDARYQPVIHDLGPNGLLALKAEDKLLQFTPDRNDPMIHRFFTAAVSASIELAARRYPVRMIFEEEMGERIRSKSRAMVLAGIPQRIILPDMRFGLEYLPNGGFRFFAVEIDRNTESAERTRSGQTSIEEKLLAYDQAFRDRTFRAQWGIPNLTVLIYTTNERRAEKIREIINRLQNSKRFFVRSNPTFATNWAVPREPLPVEEWIGFDGSTLNIFNR